MNKVILIDDEPLIRQALKKLIERNKLNIEVIGEASNGLEGLTRIEQDKPDLIFLDIRMPLLDGFGLLKRLGESNNAVKTIILTAYRDFDYAAEAIQFGAFGYLVKPLDEMKLIEIVEKVCLKMEEERQSEQANRQLNGILQASFVERLLEGHERKTIEEDGQSIVDLEAHCQVMIVRSTMSISELEKLIQPLEPRFIFPYKGDIVVVYHLAIGEAIAILANMQTKIDNPCTFGLSNSSVPLQHVRRGYLEAKAAFFYQKNPIAPHMFLYENASADHLQQQDVIVEQGIFASFAEKLALGLPKEAMDLIGQFKERITEAMIVDLDLVYHHFFEFVMQLKQRLAKSNGQDRVKPWMASLQYSDLQSYRTMDALFAFFEQLTSECASMTHMEESTRMIHKIKAYIHENYAGDISLNSLAEQLFVSKNYVSTIFKQKTGINFLDYVTQVRMEQAKQRLETTEKGINQIAEEIGYRNPSHFGKVFKQEVGITPAEYRQRIAINQ